MENPQQTHTHVHSRAILSSECNCTKTTQAVWERKKAGVAFIWEWREQFYRLRHYFHFKKLLWNMLSNKNVLKYPFSYFDFIYLIIFILFGQITWEFFNNFTQESKAQSVSPLLCQIVCVCVFVMPAARARPSDLWWLWAIKGHEQSS